MQRLNLKELQFLDGIRGLAALYVVFGHARWLLWEGYSEGYLSHPESYSISARGIMYFFSLFIYGHEAVLLFFILSGFVIHLKYVHRFSYQSNTKIDVLTFWWRRVKRLYPPLIFSILLVLLLDNLGMFLEYPIYFDATPYSSINSNFVTNHDWETFLGNMAFLTRFYVPEYGTNGPLWSLAYEGWFYILFPIFLIFMRKSFLWPSIAITTFYIIANVFSFHVILLDKVFGMMLIWWLGAFMAEIYVGRIKMSFKWLIPLIVLLPLLFVKVIHFQNSAVHTLGWSLGFIGMFALLFHFKHKRLLLRPLEKLKPLGDFSYSLYILHMPIMVFMSGAIMRYNNGFLPQHFYFVLAGIVICLIITYLLHFIIEKPFLSSHKPDSQRTTRLLNKVKEVI